uniref:UDP-glycosyltransferases domain-containing protein n=1 Tax=Glossina pallidipes TaxID=7398 RepID=A0A1A9ZNZ7_GLOPL
MEINFSVWLVIQHITTLCVAKRILGVFPHFGYSHFKVYYPLLHALAERGHNVTVITYIHSPNSPEFYEEWLLKGEQVKETVSLGDTWPARSWDILFKEYLSLHREGQSSCKKLYESGFVQRALDQHLIQPYDLVITEYFNTDCHLALPYLMNLPIVGFSSCLLMPWYYERLLMPDTPSYIQSEFIGYPEPLKWYQRTENFLQAKIFRLLYRFYTNQCDNLLIKSYFEWLYPDVNSIAKRQTLIVFGNQHYSLMGIRPSTQQFIEVGGIHINESSINDRELPKDIKAFLENTDKDVLFISWGSMIKFSTMPNTIVENIVTALLQLDVKVIWKWENDKIPLTSEKFLFVKWAPQLQLLCHPKIKYFWGHGGLLGITEALYCGKPMLITPIYGDHFVNSYAVKNREIGYVLDWFKISFDWYGLYEAFENLRRSGYEHRAKELSEMFRHRENKPIDTAVWWVEHLLKYKNTSETLRSYAVELNWFVFNSLDAIMVIIVLIVIIKKLVGIEGNTFMDFLNAGLIFIVSFCAFFAAIVRRE